MPYGFAQRDADVQNYFRDNIRLVRPTIPIRWDNVDFDPPSASEWIGLSIRPAVHGIAGLHEGCHRDEGFIHIQCFAPLHEGTTELMELCDEVVKLFHGKRLKGTMFQDTSVNVLGARDAYYSANVTVDYISDWFE